MSGGVGIVAIGRNEGARLVACLASLADRAGSVVYVDSGSTDGSVDTARSHGVEVVELDPARPFSAARARNEGAAHLRARLPDPDYIQFIDGDCELAPGWIDTAVAVMEADPEIAVACGRLYEKFPHATVWNGMQDREWNTPVGEAKACGGIALIRRTAFEAAGGFREDLIAGEEPEMCYRMRQDGWTIRRLDAGMAHHDAAMTRVSQWWQRTRRAGHTYAEGAFLHGSGAERYKVAELRRTLVWGIALPLATLLAVILFGGWGLLLLLAWPAQVLRLRLRGKPWPDAVFLTVGKLAEAQGALGFWRDRLSGRRRGLIEYK